MPASTTQKQEGSKVKSDLSSPKAEVRRSIHLKNITPMQVLQKLSEEFGFNYIAEEFVQEIATETQTFDIENQTVWEALEVFQNRYQRNRIDLGQILVFTPRNASYLRNQQKDVLENRALSFPLSKNKIERAFLSTETNKILPARFVTITVSSMPIAIFLKQIADISLYRFTPCDEMKSYYISANMGIISPSKVMEAIAWLTDTTPSVIFFRSKAQQEKVNYDNDSKSPREKDAEKLRARLNKYLTPTERDAINNQKVVELSLSRLNANDRKAAEDYINSVANRIGIASNMIGQNRFKDFSIVFAPIQQAPGGALGVRGVDSNGDYIGF
jgi:hypothetical protein